MNRARSTLLRGIAGLPPNIFALVMATGIVSVASQLQGHGALARGLLVVNAVAYVTLWGLTIARLVRYRDRVKADILDHGRVPGFLTVVAGTGVLGTQVLVVLGDPALPTALWLLTVVLWTVLTYGFFAVVTVKQDKPPIERGLGGIWLLVVVATQSVAVLGALVAHHFGAGTSREAALLLCLCLFLIGTVLYLVLITFILYRFTFFAFTSVQLAPPYWINMGAVAISAVAGANLIGALPLWPELVAFEPFVRGLTLLFWAVASWWIPLLVILGIWRHGIQRLRLGYDSQYWGLIFPLGMYSTACHRLANVLGLPVLEIPARVFLWVALAAWSVTSLGLLRHIFKPTATPTVAEGS